MLVFSYVGFKTLELSLDGQTKLDVNLISDISKLDEVVVVGYGSIQRKDLTGAVSTIKSEEIEKLTQHLLKVQLHQKQLVFKLLALKVVLILHSKLELEAVRQ